jgi:riboflavin kinase / FMN adenylyltransferase
MKNTISGKVIRGDNYGKHLGFPTANIDRRQFVRLKPIKHGIYAGRVTLPSGRSHKAGIVIGPLDKRGLPKIEAHLINFHGNLYGKTITLHLKKYLRPFRPYKSELLLKQQINRDIRNIKQLNFHD